MLGRDIKHLPEDIEKIYKELRNDVKNTSYTSAILLGRKLLMHLAVEKASAKEGQKFVQYIKHLKSSGFVPPNGDKLLKFIKDLGNEKNHEIKEGFQEEANKMIKFIEILLIVMYEMTGDFNNSGENFEDIIEE
ncbi:MAG: DUF4145 domain-containing protein [bacterium]